MNSASCIWRWTSSNQEYFNLWACFEGKGTLQLDDGVYDVSPGMAVLIRPGETSIGQQTLNSHFVNLGMHFLPNLAKDTARLARLEARSVRLRHLSLVRDLAVYLDERIPDPARNGAEAIHRVAGVLLEVFLDNLSLGPEDPVDERLRLLSEQFRIYPGREWRMPDAAREAGLSVSQFGRRFRLQFGVSPQQFLLRQRIERARNLLMESTLNVSQIADQLGYQDIGYFSRQFKQNTGLSPLEFRRCGRGQAKD